MNRFCWILVTFLTRPLLWLMVLAMIGGGIYLYNMSSDEYETATPEVFHSMTPIRSTTELERVSQSARNVGIEIDWGGLSSEQVLMTVARPGSGSTRISDEQHDEINQRLNRLRLPENVVAIRTHSWSVDQDLIDHLGTIKSLRRLGFLVQYSSDPLDLSPLANLLDLRLLDLGIGSSGSTSLAPLKDLPKLSTLLMGSQQWVRERTMSEVAELPHLTTLYLPDISENKTAMSALSQLGRSSSLNEIRVAISLDQPEKLAAVQSAVGDIPVRSCMYFPSRVYALVYALWASLIIGSIGIHLIGLFSLPLAELAPKYQAAHQRVVWTVIGALVVVLTIVVCWFGAKWYAVISIIGMCTMAGAGDSVLATNRMGARRGLRGWLTFIGTVMFFLALIMAWRKPLLAEQYLMGGLPLLCVVFTAIAAYAGLHTSVALNALCRTGLAQARPLILSMQDMQRANLEMQRRKNESMSTAEPFENQRKVAIWLSYGTLGAFALWYFAPEPLYGYNAANYMAMATLFITLFALALVGTKWWHRVPYLAAMITRPPSKRQQVRKLFIAIGADFLRLWPLALANLLFLMNAPLLSSDSLIARTLVSGVVVFSTAGIFYAVTLWALTIRSMLGVIILGISIHLGVTFLAVSTVAFGATMEEVLPLQYLMIAAVLIALVAAGLFAGARAYFATLEWGRFL